MGRALKALPAISRSGDAPAALLNARGVAEMLNGKIEQALELFDRALEREEKSDEIRFNRGVALVRLERFSEAAATFRMIAESPESPLRAAAAYHVAVAIDHGGNPAGAEQWLERALAADSELDSALLYRGVIREKQQKFAAAGEAYRDYMQRNPESVVAMLRFGVCAHRAGHPETARKYLQQVVQLAPASAEAAEARKFLVMY